MQYIYSVNLIAKPFTVGNAYRVVNNHQLFIKQQIQINSYHKTPCEVYEIFVYFEGKRKGRKGGRDMSFILSCSFFLFDVTRIDF